jgi:hypothetical protein
MKLEPGSAPDQVRLLITNYVKPNDSMSITFDRAAKAIQGVQIASYMDSASDVVKIAVQFAVQFAKLPDGTNHISTMSVDGVSKQLNVLVETTTTRSCEPRPNVADVSGRDLNETRLQSRRG